MSEWMNTRTMAKRMIGCAAMLIERSTDSGALVGTAVTAASLIVRSCLRRRGCSWRRSASARLCAPVDAQRACAHQSMPTRLYACGNEAVVAADRHWNIIKCWKETGKTSWQQPVRVRSVYFGSAGGRSSTWRSHLHMRSSVVVPTFSFVRAGIMAKHSCLRRSAPARLQLPV